MYRMVRINELRSLDPAAWTQLLEQDHEIQGTSVTAVHVDLAKKDNVTRYLVCLDGYSEPITFIGKQTNRIEAQFYQTISQYLSVLTPKCWFSHLNGDDSWVILSETYEDWSPYHWTTGDVEAIIKDICDLHATFWNQAEHLDRFDWPYLLPKKGAARQGRQVINHSLNYGPDDESVWNQSYQPLPENQSVFISDHMLRAAGPLTPRLVMAAKGLEKIQELGGWPTIFGDQHFLAAADLLDDPIPMLQPLQELPITLLHGNLSPSNWRVTLFGEHFLTDWAHMIVGPGIFDLVHFIEKFDLVSDGYGWRTRNSWPVLEETMIDSYLLNMGRRVGSDFNATAVRQAVPAARCLYVIMTWLPRFASWFQTIPNNGQDWLTFNEMCDEELSEAGYDRIVGIRPYLTDLFRRFLRAYRQL